MRPYARHVADYWHLRPRSERPEWLWGVRPETEGTLGGLSAIGAKPGNCCQFPLEGLVYVRAKGAQYTKSLDGDSWGRGERDRSHVGHRIFEG